MLHTAARVKGITKLEKTILATMGGVFDETALNEALGSEALSARYAEALLAYVVDNADNPWTVAKVHKDAELDDNDTTCPVCADHDVTSTAIAANRNHFALLLRRDGKTGEQCPMVYHLACLGALATSTGRVWCSETARGVPFDGNWDAVYPLERSLTDLAQRRATASLVLTSATATPSSDDEPLSTGVIDGTFAGTYDPAKIRSRVRVKFVQHGTLSGRLAKRAYADAPTVKVTVVAEDTLLRTRRVLQHTFNVRTDGLVEVPTDRMQGPHFVLPNAMVLHHEFAEDEVHVMLVLDAIDSNGVLVARTTKMPDRTTDLGYRVREVRAWTRQA